jgi:hypothetical protein
VLLDQLVGPFGAHRGLVMHAPRAGGADPHRPALASETMVALIVFCFFLPDTNARRPGRLAFGRRTWISVPSNRTTSPSDCCRYGGPVHTRKHRDRPVRQSQPQPGHGSQQPVAQTQRLGVARAGPAAPVPAAAAAVQPSFAGGGERPGQSSVTSTDHY